MYIIKNRLQFLFVLLIFSVFVSAQDTISGVVVDANTLETLPFVNIGIEDLVKGTVSDLDGNYEMEDISIEQRIIFSAIGYTSVNIGVDSLLQMDTIKMYPRAYSFDLIEVTTTRINKEEVLLGAKNETRGHSIGFGSTQLGTEIGSIVSISSTTYIRSVHFVLNHATGDSLFFRVNIYDYRDGKIGENLLRKNLLIQEKQRKGVISLDLSEYDIILDSDVILSLEWIRNNEQTGNEGITFDTKKMKKSKGIFYRRSSNGKFEKLSYRKNLKPCFYFIGSTVVPSK